MLLYPAAHPPMYDATSLTEAWSRWLSALESRSAHIASSIAIDFEHGLKSRTLRVWVDEDLVLNTRLESREKKKLIAFKSRKGAATEVLDVKPGTHDVRVQVTWVDKAKTETGNFRSGVTRKLDIRVDLSVGWN